MEIMRSHPHNTVSFDGTYYIKEFKHHRHHLNEEWAMLYDGLYNKFPDITPELIDFVPGKKIVMEAVEGLTPQQIKYERSSETILNDLKKLLSISQKITSAFAEYSLDLKDTYYCYHYDLNPGNLIIQDLDKLKFKFIDIDSIRFDYAFMRQSLFDTWIADMYSEYRCMKLAEGQAWDTFFTAVRN